MDEYSRIDKGLITHMLAYVTPEQWADAMVGDYRSEKEDIIELMVIQEDRYAFNLKADVEAIVADILWKKAEKEQKRKNAEKEQEDGSK